MEQLEVRQKAEALERMKALKLRKEVIDAFAATGSIHLCTRPNGSFLTLTTDETNEVKAFERKHGAMVFLVSRAVTLFGSLDAYFYVSNDPSNWAYERDGYDKGYAATYVFNRNYPNCSEDGDICFKRTKNGGIIRTDIDFF